MQRRDFLKYLLSTPLASVIDYEKILWVPGEKKIFIPKSLFVPHPAQIAFMSNAQAMFYGGAVGGGKTLMNYNKLHTFWKQFNS